MVIPIVIAILGLIGFADSAYYTMVHYGILGFGAPLMPIICNPKEGVCEMLSRTSWASILGLPNSLYGMGYYALVLLTAGARIATGEWHFPRPFIAISILAALFSLYLAWLMVFQVKEICPLCLAAQVINVILAVVIVSTVR